MRRNATLKSRPASLRTPAPPRRSPPSHPQFPGIGHLAINGKGYTYEPVNYQRGK